MTPKKYPMPTHCPVSGEPLEVTGLVGPTSGVKLEGRFQPNEFTLLAPEQLEFLRMFVRARGNLKEVERSLGVSYPTVRLRLETMLKALGYEGDAAPDAGKGGARADILSRLEAGDIDAAEAAKQLRALKIRS
ncbi:MAG: DUF2089 domain-containing protein [Trueperaceae bacterium]|nr:DUF2089 domain-containing protein [Trueperaceae bacterium]